MKPRPEYYTSPLSTYCADQLAGDFHYLDGDEVLFRHSALPIVYRRASGILRILESKNPGEELRRSQRETFPLLAGALALAVDADLIDRRSGVFIVEGTPPWSDGARVIRIRPARHRRDWLAEGAQPDAERRLTRADVDHFIGCRP